MRLKVARAASEQRAARAVVRSPASTRGPHPAPTGPAAELLALQRSHGNRFVQALLRGGARSIGSEGEELLRFETNPPSAFQVACSPAGVTHDKVVAIPGASPGSLGHTKPEKMEFGLKGDFDNGTCKAVLTQEPTLAFKHFVYTKEGTYPIGTTEDPKGRCKGKVNAFLKITRKMAERIKDGEIEHCKDARRAFALSHGKYVAAVKQLARGFPAKDRKTCNAELLKRLADKVGLDPSRWTTFADCLFAKTLERDKTWHQVDPGPAQFSADCKTATFTPDPATSLTEVGKHPSDEVVKGCT
jgi:hypothetical protein